MTGEIVQVGNGVQTTTSGSQALPVIIVQARGNAQKRFIEFFAAQIRNRNTREAYVRAVTDFFEWCEEYDIGALIDIEPIHVAAWVELKTRAFEPQTVKQQLAALRHLFDWLVTGQVVATNPAAFVRGPKFSYSKGKTPILTPQKARRLIRAIPTDTTVGLRDRALIGLMIYTFARISAALNMDVKDVYPKQENLWVRLHEKGGKHREMPCNSLSRIEKIEFHKQLPDDEKVHRIQDILQQQGDERQTLGGQIRQFKEDLQHDSEEQAY